MRNLSARIRSGGFSLRAIPQWSAVLALALGGPGLAFPQSTYEEMELSSRNLVLPEAEQFRLASRLFAEKDKKLAAWKAYQTFLFNYADSDLAGDAQFMLAESIFAQAVGDLRVGNPPDELNWRRQKKSGLKVLGKGFKKGFEGLKDIGARVAGEPVSTKEPEQIDVATFSEAIEQYGLVLKKYKKWGLSDTALYRIAESYYNMGDYPNALAHFKQVLEDYPHSYLAGESLLGSAQCYIPGGDFGSAELELKKLLTTYPSYNDNPQVQFMMGIIRFQEGKYDEALKYLEPLPTAEAVFYSGQALVKMGKSFSATAKFKRVMEDFKDSGFAEEAAYLMGDSFFLSKNFAGAIQEFKHFLTLHTQSALREGVLYKIAASHFLKKDYPAARENFNLLINAYPQGEFASLARYFIAESYRLSSQMKEASFAYGQLIAALPNAPVTANARFKLAWVTYQQKNYSSAAELFQKFIDWHPFHAWVPTAYLLMGNSYSVLGKTEEAANDYQQAFDGSQGTELAEAAMALLNRTRYVQANYGQLTSGYTYILKSLPPSESKWRAFSQLYLADAYYRQKLYKDAITVFNSIISLYPNQPVAVRARDGLSWCYFQLGDYEASQVERKKIQEVRLPEGVQAPAIGSGAYELANALFNQKKYAEAQEQYEKFLRESPNSKDAPEAIYRIGLSYYRQEFYTQAIATWEDLAQKYPKHERTEEAVFQIADTYFRAQKYDKAIETYRRILTQYPNNAGIPDAALRIGQSYYNAGDDGKALAELEAFIRKYNSNPKAVETLDMVEASLDRREARGEAALKAQGVQLLRGLAESYPQTALGAELQFRIARRYFNWKDYANAIPEFEKLVVNYPDSPHLAESEFYAAESAYTLKRFDDAIVAFQRFLQNFPSSEFAGAAWFHLGTSQFNRQRYAEAIESYRGLLQSAPNSEFASAGLNNMALSQKKLQNLTEAADTYTKLALNYPKDPYAQDALLEAAKLKKDLKQYGEAILILKDLEPKFPAGDERKFESIALIGECYAANGDLEEAARILQGLAKSGSANWKLEAGRQLGEIYEKQERWMEAAQVYEEAARAAGNSTVGNSFRQRAKYLRETYSGPKGKPAKTTGSHP